MKQAETSQQRIRQVAIVLSSVDPVTKQRLITQLPTDQARQVRQEIARLGEIDPKERAAAMAAFQQRSASITTSRPSPQNSGSSLNASSQGAQSSEFNPALALAQSYPVEDAGSWSAPKTSESRQQDTEGFERFATTGSFSSTSFSTGPSSGNVSLQQMSTEQGADIARLVENERPTLIAAILQQSSNELGGAILAALPPKTAATALATLPGLQSIDDVVMKEIHQAIQEKLNIYRSQLSPNAPSVQRVQRFLGSMPDGARKALERSLWFENSQLAQSVGAEHPVTAADSIAQSSKESPSNVAKSLDASASKSTSLEPSHCSKLTPHAIEHKSIYDFNLTFDDLDDLSLADFAKVLQQVAPETVLIAATGAAFHMRSRLEAMIEPGHVHRLRVKLHEYRKIEPSRRTEARQVLVEKAMQMIRSNQIELPIFHSQLQVA